MTGLFKIIGLILVFSVSAGLGAVKARGVKRREEDLRGIVSALGELSSRIMMTDIKIYELIGRCFSENIVEAGKGEALFEVKGLEKGDKKLLEEFLCDVGMRDSKAEQERIALYSALFKDRLFNAAEKSASLCRLYNALGILCGIFLCIFFL